MLWKESFLYVKFGGCLSSNIHFIKAQLLLLGSPMPIDPHPSLQHVGPQHTVLQAQQEVTRYKARFKPTLQKKSDLLLAFICFPRFTHLQAVKIPDGRFLSPDRKSWPWGHPDASWGSGTTRIGSYPSHGEHLQSFQACDIGFRFST